MSGNGRRSYQTSDDNGQAVEVKRAGPCERVWPTLIAYIYGSLATVIKTFAWWFNQWPEINGLNFFAKWAISASIAGCEYAPLTLSFSTANNNGVHLGLMTAYMEAADNLFRMLQQLFLGDPLAWFDWIGALGLGLCVAWQGYMHYRDDARKSHQQHATPTESTTLLDPSTANTDLEDAAGASVTPSATQAAAPARTYCGFDLERFLILVIGSAILISGSPTVALFGGPTGQAYVCATLATAAKTFAWWINQYPQLKHLSFYKKWLAGWSIAAFIEYLPLIGAMTIASDHGVHLGLMTAYMEALDNFFRILQQRLLQKPLAWYDYTAAAGMFLFVFFQGGARFAHDHGVNINP